MRRGPLGPVLFMLLSVPFVSAADVSGKWSGSLEIKTPDGKTAALPAYAEFKQEGASVTGAVWKEADDQFPVEKGKIDGNRITFEFLAQEGSEDSKPLVHSVRLAVVGETQLQGQMEFEDGGNKVTAKLTFTRDK
jgi:hypothetical protein